MSITGPWCAIWVISEIDHYGNAVHFLTTVHIKCLATLNFSKISAASCP